MTALQNYHNLKDKFIGKVVAGESAGANVQATFCYSKYGGSTMKGLGILPVFMYPHYKKGDEKR
jgi:peptidase E